MIRGTELKSWAERQTEIARLSETQIFFVGGAPRSGTTWLQQICDSHPDISCQGEGLFLNHLAVPMQKMMVERAKVIDGKNKQIFKHTGGYPIPLSDDVEFMAATGILLALHQQTGGKSFKAVGEKTPENVFHFAKLIELFPKAKFVAIARDPRDVLTSAWHFFRKPAAPDEGVAIKTEFIRTALPSLNDGARQMLAFGDKYPNSYFQLTYERLNADPAPIVRDLFKFLGVSNADSVVDSALVKTAFTSQTAGRPKGAVQNGEFFRKGTAGDWPSTLTRDMSDMVLKELGWMYPRFGWKP
jgi:Sulfotransferase family